MLVHDWLSGPDIAEATQAQAALQLAEDALDAVLAELHAFDPKMNLQSNSP